MLGLKWVCSAKNAGLIGILTVLAVLVLVKNSHALMRIMVGQEIELKTAGYEEVQTEHFRIRYTSSDSSYIGLIAATAEEAYAAVCNMFKQEIARKTVIIVYPDSPSLASSFGWDKDQKAMGVYWGGTIRILSPREWLAGTDIKEQFAREGPMVHEFAHLMVDEITRGNYSRWLTEGIAQYVEKKITGFEFSYPFVDGRELEYYPFAVMGRDFDNLNQQVVYWESLKAVEYLTAEYGEEALFLLLENLGKGYGIAQALEKALGVSYEDFEQGFYKELKQNYG